MKKLTINVTAEDIRLGKKDQPASCAIARAAKRLGLKKVNVDNTLDFSKDGREWFAVLPSKAKEFINRFDDGAKVKPFSFSVEVQEDTYPGEAYRNE